MSKPTEIQGLMSQLKQAADKLKTRIHALDDLIEALYAQRSSILSGPLSKTDYLAAVRTDIQTKARMFKTNLQRHLQVGNKINYPAVAQAGAGGLPLRYLDAGSNHGMEMPEGAYYFYLEDVIVAGVERVLEGHEWPSDAVPAAERKKALQAIDGQLEALTVERDALAGELVACGLTE